MLTLPHRRALLGGGAAFSPAQIAGLNLWLRSDAGLFQDTGGTTPAVGNTDPVGLWKDQSGNARNFSQSNLTKRPTLSLAGGVNARRAVQADGVDDFMLATGPSALPAGSATCYAVLTGVGTSVATHYLLDVQTGRLIFVLGESSTPVKTGWYDGSFKGIATTISGNQVLSWVLTGGGNGQVWRNGVSLGSAAYVQVALNGTWGLFATQDTGTNNLAASLSELLLYTGAHSDATRVQVQNYLNNSWGGVF